MQLHLFISLANQFNFFTIYFSIIVVCGFWSWLILNKTRLEFFYFIYHQKRCIYYFFRWVLIMYRRKNFLLWCVYFCFFTNWLIIYMRLIYHKKRCIYYFFRWVLIMYRRKNILLRCVYFCFFTDGLIIYMRLNIYLF